MAAPAPVGVRSDHHPPPRRPDARSSRRVVVVIVAAALLLVAPLLSVVFGAASVPPGQALAVIWGHLPFTDAPVTWDRITEAIIWNNRMPRVLTGIGVGAVLGVSGVAFQAVVRNPLAEPYVLGVSSGASVGAATAIVVVGVTASFTVAGFAFLGAGTATVVVLLVGGRGAGSTLQLILAGLAVGFVCQSGTNLLIFSARTAETAQSVVFWTLGSLTRADWPQVWLVLCTAALLSVALWVAAPFLDALASGDATCLAVGLNPAIARVAILIPVSAAVSVVVAVAGGIGFVGLVVPHVLRPLVGFAHRWLVVTSSMVAAVFLTAADTVSRTLFSPVELPIGVITGLIGAPFLLLLIGRSTARTGAT